MPSLRVHLLPALTAPAELAGRTIVVVDILRATTTVVHALAAGTQKVIPLLEIDEARARKTQLGAQALLGGERGGKRIDGFDFGNSPAEFTSERLAGKTLLFTTTNGTRALAHAQQGKRVLLGAFVNLSAICRELAAAEEIDILCAGTDQEITREDVLFAGAVATELRAARSYECNDQAEIAADAWRSAVQQMTAGSPLAALLRGSQGARNLIEIGQERDIEICATVDKFDLVPVLDVPRWEIVPA